MIISDIVKSHAEDIVFQAFHAERNEQVFSPATAFTGLFSTMDMLVTSGYIAAGENNLKTTGAFGVAETKDQDYDRLVEFIGSADPFLRSSQTGTPQLLVTETVLKSVASGAAGSWSLSNLGPRIINNSFGPGFFVEHFIKDMGIALAEARKIVAGQRTEPLETTRVVLDLTEAELRESIVQRPVFTAVHGLLADEALHLGGEALGEVPHVERDAEDVGRVSWRDSPDCSARST